MATNTLKFDPLQVCDFATYVTYIYIDRLISRIRSIKLSYQKPKGYLIEEIYLHSESETSIVMQASEEFMY